MALQRVEWTCPGCRRKYAIPATAATPTLCPSCQQVGQPSPPIPLPQGEKGEEISRGRETAPQREREQNDNESGMPAGFPPLFELQVEEAIVRTKPAVVACSGKHSVLRMFVPGYRILAGLLALGAVAGLLYSIRSAVTMKGEAERMGAISLGFGIFVASGLAALLHLAIAELIRVVLNIEENTHAR